jgi:AcrR family transcriptional regulator
MTRETQQTDGRRRRGEDSRERIIAAMLAFVREGEVAPGAERVAIRAEVGLRTVFRHFRDMDSLYAEMSSTIEGELSDLATRPFESPDEAGRLSDFLARGHAQMVSHLRQDLARDLPVACAEPGRLEALDLLLSFEAWSRLRREQGLSREDAEAIVRRLATALLTTP